MNSVQVLLSDTHFGVRNNSINWLESQKDFIYKQFIPYLKKIKNVDQVTVIHLGDVFDSRSSISPMICKETNKILEDISNHCDDFIILAGNHDFFSPIEGSDNSTSLEMLPCLWKENNIKILYNDYLTIEDENIFIPWFQFHNIDTLKKILKEGDYKNVFTHTDIAHLDEETLSLLKGKNIFTGHVHIPMIRKSKGWFTLGSCYYINFQDSNSERGFYTLEDWDSNTLEFIPNEESIRFHRIMNEEILDFSCPSSDYIELSIKDTLYERQDIQEKIKEINSECQHFTVVIEQQDISVNDSCEPDMGIYSIVKNCCPENLRDKLETVVTSLDQ